MKEKLQVHSDAWPEEEKQELCSKVHELLAARKDSITINDIAFRPLEKADIQEVRDLHREWFPISYDYRYYEATTTDPNSVALGAFYVKKGRRARTLLVGAILARLQFDDSVADAINQRGICYKLARALNCFRKPDIILYIMTFGVADELRRLGIGSELLKRCVEAGRAKVPKCKGVSLHVIEHNHTAIAFYKKQGYRQLQYNKDYYHIKGKVHSSYIFGKLFEDKESKEE
eukprot:TRINITY_DN10670_c0_g1_i4.p1 TRINITY_DN10670_c0_g1~~TRINITY_DN10670_c0_g1_i4.p1  ORF type:complete len:231 (-),score=44.85 TRINITY_DN10670_c0_g1_i4:510-1202(-)